ncbi:MAG: methionine sulfoxide reductase [Firmicutes bacterium ML8_F2]|jgi:peptide-methionine (S)-S-oxide reductase|nr:MAG: methionine sulfoxide reductase [Firmicutes bacterium ML8_F2]
MNGIYHTLVGYAGGTKDNPSYYALGDHTETLQIEYDPSLISFKEILQVFWDSHNPVSRSGSRQYAAIIFYHNEEQKEAALESRTVLEQQLQKTIYTEVLPYSRFFPAEDYHQKYYLQGNRELTAEMRSYYPDFKDFIRSTAAARLNGYLGGFGNAALLDAEIDQLGLSSRGREVILNQVD